jgi:energy-coupling factor transporter ATPase
VAIDIDDILFTYRSGERDAIPALSDVTFQLAASSFIAVIGHNGSGKSTLARLLSALLFPQAGTIRIDGVESSQRTRWHIREHVAMVFQDPDDQLVATRVVDDIAFGPENLGLPREEIAARVNTALEMLDLEPVRDTLIEELSTAQKQMVAIVGALAMRPRVLVLDEPTSFLSRSAASELIDRLREVNRRFHTSILYITHDMTEAARFDRIIVLDAGRIVLDGSPAEVFEHETELREIGLDVPLSVQVRNRLRDSGLTIPMVTTPRELRNALAGVIETIPAGERLR